MRSLSLPKSVKQADPQALATEKADPKEVQHPQVEAPAHEMIFLPPPQARESSATHFVYL
jgi:hypothetical protein